MLKRIDVISLFPQMFDALHTGITGRALRRGLLELGVTNPRDFTHDKHHTVDDRPYGGGPGMLMKVQPLRDAIMAVQSGVQRATAQRATAQSATAQSATAQKAEQEIPSGTDTSIESGRSNSKSNNSTRGKVIYLSPQGITLTQTLVNELSEHEHLILIAGRYEGIDERVIEHYVDYECSIGDYVLSGGELPAMVLIDALIRLIPGALGHCESALNDSFYTGLLDHAHYTRPVTFEGKSVPAVLLSGDHKKIEQWRLKQALGRTWKRRPDLLENLELNEQQQQLLQAFIQEEI